VSSSLCLDNTSPAIGQDVTATYTIKNNSSSPITLPILGVGARLNSTNVQDFGLEPNITIQGGASYTKSFTKRITQLGYYTSYVGFVYNGIWINALADSGKSPRADFISRVPDLRMSSGITLNPSSPVVGQTVNAKATIRNYENKPVNISTVGVTNWSNYPVFSPQDYGFKYTVTLAPFGDASGNDYLAFDYSKALPVASNNYQAWVDYLIGGAWYNVPNSAVSYEVAG